MNQDAIFHLAQSAEAAEGDPSLPYVFNIGAAVCDQQESEKCELTSCRVAVMGCCPFRVYLCHGDISDFENVWYGSNVEKHKDVLASVSSSWIGNNDHYAVIECNKCQVRVEQHTGPLNVVVAWGGMAHNTATKVDVSGTVSKGWRPVAIKAGGKTVLDYQGGIHLGRQFGKAAVKAAVAKHASKAAKKVFKKSKVIRKSKPMKAKGKKVLSKSKKLVLKKGAKKAKKASKSASKDWRAML